MFAASVSVLSRSVCMGSQMLAESVLEKCWRKLENEMNERYEGLAVGVVSICAS